MLQAQVSLRLTLFDPFSANFVSAGKETTLSIAGRSSGLLVLLALSAGHYCSRQTLIQQLWPGNADSIGAGAFNTVLWRLRSALNRAVKEAECLVEADRQGGLRISKAVEVHVDMETYGRAVEPLLQKSIENMSPHDCAQLKSAVAHYTGDVLSSFHEDWALRLRERHRHLQVSALLRLMHLSSLTTSWSEAIHYGEAVLEIDALREDVHRALMRCFVAAGQRAKALQQFEQCRSALWRELSIAPMAETLQLMRQISEANHFSPSPIALREPQPQPSDGTERRLNWAKARWHLDQAERLLKPR